MTRRPPGTTRTEPPFPFTTLFRSQSATRVKLSLILLPGVNLPLRPEEGGRGIAGKRREADRPVAGGGEGEHQPGHPLAFGEGGLAVDLAAARLSVARDEEAERGRGEGEATQAPRLAHRPATGTDAPPHAKDSSR